MNRKLVKVAQTFRWEMGHRLPYHQGGCGNLHGHSYKLVVEVEGAIDEKTGMVIDFYRIQEIVKPIIDQLDHSFMCSENDEKMKVFLEKSGFKVVFVDFESTAENIALYFLDKLTGRFKKYENLRGIHLRVYETENEYAEVSTVFR